MAAVLLVSVVVLVLAGVGSVVAVVSRWRGCDPFGEQC